MAKGCLLLYVAGLHVSCEGCYNVATWSFNTGIPYTKSQKNESWQIVQPYNRAWPCLETPFLLHWHPSALGQARERVARQDIWSWTGYWEEMMLETPDQTRASR